MVYDFEKNAWQRPELKGGVEPELRCNARMVYDPVHGICAFLIKTRKIVHLFRYNPRTAKYTAAR